MKALPEMYALSPWTCGPQEYISGKARVTSITVCNTYQANSLKLFALGDQSPKPT